MPKTKRVKQPVSAPVEPDGVVSTRPTSTTEPQAGLLGRHDVRMGPSDQGDSQRPITRSVSKAFEAVMLGGGETVELRMYGEIGDGFFYGDGITAKRVSETLTGAPNAKVINVRMSSPGGSVWEGMAIRSMLSGHPARVEVDIEGLCASAATLVAMAGDSIRMHTGSSMMIHEGSRSTRGDLREHQRSISLLEAVNDGAASVFAARCGKTKEEILALMAAETWLTPESAKEMGLADEIIAGKVKPVPEMTLDVSRFGYRNVPPHIAAVSMRLAGEEARPTARDAGNTTTEPTGRTADVNPPEENKPMSYARIAMALGLSGEGATAEEGAVMGAITNINKKISQHDVLMTELRGITGKSSDAEVLGAVRGLVEAAGQVTQLRERLTQLEAQNEAGERDRLIAADAADPKGRKLTPAIAALYKTRSAAELKAFLDVAPYVLAAPNKDQTEPPVMTGGAGGESPQTGPLKWNGKTWAEMSNVEKHNLHVENPDVYNQLRAAHRGQAA